jgi:nitrogen-specific signal transduction histidine kinase
MLQTEKIAALGQIVSGIAHELNNPLTAIMVYAQLLLGHGLVASQLAEARNVYHEAERARRIVKNLLYFARENKPERSGVDLNEIVERTLALRSYELKVENIRVHCDLATDLPKTMADPYQLQQVVLNLVLNAEQALMEKQPQGKVEVRTRRVDFIARVGDFVPLASALIARRLKQPHMPHLDTCASAEERPSGIGEIFRHEINNPLTGILGNAELVFAHREHFSSVEIQRLQTVVDLAVRLRENIRRISNNWEDDRPSKTS